ncbi:MAG: bifunctional DedA family/phosphatase PAP2 family protein [Deferrisomatales bacterium]
MADPTLLYLAVFAAAFGESTAFVGLIVPGVGLVVGAGVLAARGFGDPWWVAGLASLGAVAGFGLSYHLGRAGGSRMARWGRRAQDARDRAAGFFHRFGAWSVFWGHFFGPVRALVAFAAGAAGLPARRFWTASVLGAVAWGHGLTLAGVAAAGGLAAAEASLGRASLVVAALVVLAYLALRLAAGLVLLGVRGLPSAAAALARGLTAARESRFLNRLVPDHRAARWLGDRLAPDRATGLLLTAGALAAAAFAWLFLGVAEDLLFQDPLVRVDQNLFHWLQTLRTPGGDRFFLLLTEAGAAPVIGAGLAAGCACLLWLRRPFEAGLLLGGFGLGEALTWALKQGIGRPRPAPAAPLAVELTGAFPSNHAFSTLVLLGFLACLAGRGLSPRGKARLYAAVGLGVLGVGLSRLYLGVHWLSDVLGGYALGGIWLAALITAAEARRRLGPPLAPVTAGRQRTAVGLTAVALLAAWATVASPLLGRPTPPGGQPEAGDRPRPSLAESLAVPVGHLLGAPAGQPGLAVTAAREGIVEAARRAGWVPVRPFAWGALLADALAWVRGDPDPAAPVAPLFREGRPDDLVLARPLGGGRRLVRLWQTDARTGDGEPAAWVVLVQDHPPPRRFLGLRLPARPAPGPTGATGLVARDLAAGQGVRVVLGPGTP